MAETFSDVGSTGKSGELNIARWVLALIDNVPELKKIYDSAKDPKTGKFSYSEDALINMITSSDWYLTKGPTVAGNIAGRYKFGEKWYQGKVNEFKITISGIANGMGLDVNNKAIAEYLNGLAESSFLNGWDSSSRSGSAPRR